MRTLCTLVAAVCLASLVSSCGKSSSGAAGGNIVLSGTLQASARFLTDDMARSAPHWIRASAFQGYTLYCVTFSSPPVASSGTADADGNVSVTIAASGLPVGCFLLDAAQKQVATLIFNVSTAGSSSNTSATFTGDAALGAISVDLTNAIAAAALPSSGTLSPTTPTGLACPVGNWVSDAFTGDGNCGSTPNSSYFNTSIFLDASNVLHASVNGFRVLNVGGTSCQNHVFSAKSVTFDSTTQVYSFSFDAVQGSGSPGCNTNPLPVVTLRYQADAACGKLTPTGQATATGCATCPGTGGCSANLGCCGCGSVSCASTGLPPIVTKK